jgi:hypothetical protein
MNWFFEAYNTWIEPVTAVIGAAAVVAAATPTKKDEKYVGWAKSFLNILAFNFGHAKNKD